MICADNVIQSVDRLFTTENQQTKPGIIFKK